eukprot:9811653-Ditylum_brightwellii.AAC.1
MEGISTAMTSHHQVTPPQAPGVSTNEETNEEDTESVAQSVVPETEPPLQPEDVPDKPHPEDDIDLL